MDDPCTFSSCAKLYTRSAIQSIRFPEEPYKNEDGVFDIIDLAKKKIQLINERHPDLSEMAKNALVKANMSLLALFKNTYQLKYR